MADNLARIIAGAGALGTAANMLVAYANYRRTRPRVQVDILSTVILAGETEDGQFVTRQHLRVRVRNLGGTAVKVDRFELVPLVSRRESVKRRLERMKLLPGRGLRCEPGCLLMEAEEEHPAEIDAFGGITWDPLLDLDYLRRVRQEDGRERFAVRVVLSSEASVMSKPRPIPKLLDAPVEDDDRQLSFDDLSADA